jgi:uncharacterized protein
MDITHDDKNAEFFMETEKGRATLNYLREGDKLDFHHTFVPEALRGQGIAEKVVAAGFDYAKQNKLKVIPSCPYVQRLLRRHEDWKELVAWS